MRSRRSSSEVFRKCWVTLMCSAALHDMFAQASTAPLAKGAYTYIGGKTKDVSNHAPATFTSHSQPGNFHQASPTNFLAGSASSSSHAATSYFEPRGDYGASGGGGGGGGGGGWGSGGGGGSSVYSYSLHPQPYYHPAPMPYYDDGGYEGVEKGLIGLLGLGGLTGLKGLLGLLGLLKLLLPLLGLLLPLLLPLLLLKAAALLALFLLIPVPVITTGGVAPVGRRVQIPTFEEGKAYLKDTLTELLSKIPTDVNQLISKIKESSRAGVDEIDGKTSDAKSMKLKSTVDKSKTRIGGKSR